MTNNVDSCVLLGAGAVGASIGELLWQSYGEKVMLAAADERAKRYRERGFVINGRSWFPSVDDGQKPASSPCDLLIIAVKYHQLQSALTLADRFVGEQTQILSLLNGLASEEELLARYGSEHVLYGFTYRQDAVRIGNEITYQAPGKIVFGEKYNDPNRLTERVRAIKQFFEVAGVDVEVPRQTMQRLWWKLMVNTGANQSSVIHRADYGTLAQSGEAFDYMKALMMEVIALSKFTETPLSQEDFDTWVQVLATMNPRGKTSMLQDVEAKRKTEVELFGGFVIQKADQYHLSVPENTNALKKIREIESGYLN
ncbi:MAG: ketopantoate reductase family protein [Spirochaetota bacterium]